MVNYDGRVQAAVQNERAKMSESTTFNAQSLFLLFFSPQIHYRLHSSDVSLDSTDFDNNKSIVQL